MSQDRLTMDRRKFVGATVSTAAFVSSGSALAEESCQLLPLMSEGPFYPPISIPDVADLTRVPGMDGRAAGDTIELIGTISDHQCRPIEGATVEIWQSDAKGVYKHPRAQDLQAEPLDPVFRYFAKVQTRADGLYHFRTIAPSWYEVMGQKRAAHIHYRIRHPEQGDLTTLMYFDVSNEDDIRKQDQIFQGDIKQYGERLLIPKESPSAYANLGLDLESEATCCKFDLAFF